jgi:hypothetical protein
VAAVANGTIEAIDLRQAKVVARVTGLHEPQGVAWLAASGELVVACGDGSVHFYAAPPGAAGALRETASIVLGDDADNVRVDPRNGHVVVGYGSGGLATIDPATHRVLARTMFKGHPEGFRLAGGMAFVNVPDDGAILRLDLDHDRPLARWPTGLHRLNFPLAIDPQERWIAVGYRLPAALARIDMATGKTRSVLSTCGDTDDLYPVGARILVVCGAGHVDVVRGDGTEARVTTGPGARTGLYVPELHALFVALPARGRTAAIWKLGVPPGD